MTLKHQWLLVHGCSSFYSFCGNAAQQESGGGTEVRDAICGHWLRPVDSADHPRFSRWVLFGGLTAPSSSHLRHIQL